MASSFDSYEQAQTQPCLLLDDQYKVEPERSVFETVTALYSFHMQDSNSTLIRGAHPVRNGEADESPNDFICDVQIKAKRTLLLDDPRSYGLWLRLGSDAELAAKLIPPKTKEKLSLAWLNLINGYPRLFTRADKAWRAEQRRKAKAQAVAAWNAQQDATRLAMAQAVELFDQL